MTKYRSNLPQLSGGVFACYTGMETDLIFNRAHDLPGFAAYPMLETKDGRALLRWYYLQLIEMASKHNVGVMLESVSWVASRDRGAEIGYKPDALRALNMAAISMIADIRAEFPDVTIVLSAQMGPRGDGYALGAQMSAIEAENYHSEQMETLATTEADLVSAFTIGYADEAIGIIRAGQRFDMPVAIAFTVETDGKLPSGMPLGDAIKMVDSATDAAAAYYLINCAHPDDHLEDALDDAPWISRLRGIVVNASRCSHAELDNSTTLDDGDPVELGKQVASLCARFPHFTIVGGCCGTDLRHMEQIIMQTKAVKNL